jgi:predicted permease
MLMGDLRSALRTLAHSPGFTLIATALLALGIGANAVIFGALDAILLRPLPVRHPEQLVHIVQDIPRIGHRGAYPYTFYRTLLEHSTTLSTAFGEEEMQDAMESPAPAEEVRVHLLTPEFFDALNATAIVGRTLTAADALESSGALPAVLSYGFWRRRFDGDRRAVGRTIQLHGHTFTIVGVTARGFNGISIETAPDVCVPLRAAPLLETRGLIHPVESQALDLSARLKPGVTRERAQAEVRAMWLNSPEGRGSDPTALHEQVRGLPQPLLLDPLEFGTSILRQKFSGALRLLIASVGLLQLMVCANLAGLLVARGARRAGEIAIRLAIGATRMRLVRQMLVESALLALAGAGGGIALAYFAAPLLVRGLPPVRDVTTTRLALAIDFAPNARVLLYSVLVSALTALLFGIAPALAAARVSLDSVLRGARAAGGWKGRQFLLVVQIALCTLLLAGAGLLVRSFRLLRDMDPGFASAPVVSFTAKPSLSGYDVKQAGTLRRALYERVRQIPGVDSVAAAALPLMRGSGMKTTVVPAGQRATPADFLNSSLNAVTPDFFDTVGMHLLAGRTLTDADATVPKPAPVVVNQALVRHFFPEGNPLGRRFGYGSAQDPATDFEIAGVVTDAHYRSLREPIPPTIYQVLTDGDFVLYVRTHRRPESLMQPVRQALTVLDPAMAFAEVRTLAEEVDDSAAPERLTAILASIFGLFAALLAAVGLYGLLAYAVAQRQREIGIRMALGARPRAIARLVGGQALALVAIGVALGLAGALVLAPMASAILYGVGPTDPASLAAAAALVALVASLAALVPAARASRVDPAVALRE